MVFNLALFLDQSATEECPGCGRSILSTDLTFDPLNTQVPYYEICNSMNMNLF